WLCRDRLRGWLLALWLVLTALLFAGLLWTHSRSSYLALAFGLVVFGLALRPAPLPRRLAFVGAAAAVVALGAAFVHVYPSIGPRTSFTAQELACQRANAAGDVAKLARQRCYGIGETGPASAGAGAGAGQPAVEGLSDASTESHWRSL